MKILDDTLWLIRSADERTTEVCERLIKTLAPPEKVVVIRERPFSAALHRTFELGAASGLKWMVCIDADVLIYPPAMLRLLEIAESVADHIFYVQGLTIDKLIPIKRPPGNGIYRNALAGKAQQFVPADGTSLRPETTVMEGMIAAGHLMYRTNIVVGLHDFEQSYADIYRKSFLHVKKHSNVLPLMKSYWQAHREEDFDYQVALYGALVGQTYADTVYLDKHFQQQEWETLRAFKDITEKPSLDVHAYPPDKVAEIIQTFATDDTLQQLKFPQYQENYFLWPPTPWHKKWVKKTVQKVGALLIMLGKAINQLARKV